MKRNVFIIVVLFAVGMPLVPAHAGVGGALVDEGFVPAGTEDSTLGYQGVRLMERPDYTETASVLRKPAGSLWKSCTSLSDSTCNRGAGVTFSAFLQPCATSTTTNCIVDFGVVGSDGTKFPAQFERRFPAQAWNKYPADTESGLPEGAPAGLWTVAAGAGLPVSLHYVRASVQGTIDSQGKAVFTDFAASLTPVRMTTMSCKQNQGWMDSGPYPCTSGDFVTNRYPESPGYSSFVEGPGWDQGLDCEASGNADYTAETAECALRKPAALDTKYYLTVRLAQSPQGWLHGRLSDADVTITPVPGSTGAVTLALVGRPVRVPLVFRDAKFATLPKELQDKYRSNGAWPASQGLGRAGNWGPPDIDPSSPAGRNRLSISTPYGPDGIDELQAWMPYMNDTSTADRATWSLRTLRTWERGQADSCVNDTSRVTGLVLTNATQYLAGAPAHNRATGTLDYKVAAPHLMSNGDVFMGSYELIVRADVAKCIYGFSSTNITATVNVVDSKGAATPATTSASVTGGWLKLSAKGFTHSAPVVQVKFSETTGTKQVSVRVHKSTKAVSLAKDGGLTVPKGSRVSLKVSTATRKYCRVDGSVLRGLKKGTCGVTIKVTTGKKVVSKKITVAVT